MGESLARFGGTPWTGDVIGRQIQVTSIEEMVRQRESQVEGKEKVEKESRRRERSSENIGGRYQALFILDPTETANRTFGPREHQAQTRSLNGHRRSHSWGSSQTRLAGDVPKAA